MKKKFDNADGKILAMPLNLCVAGLIIGYLFKVQRWPGSEYILSGFALLMGGLYIIRFSVKPSKTVLDYIKLGLSTTLSAYAVCRFLHLPGASWLLIASACFLVLFYLFNNSTKQILPLPQDTTSFFNGIYIGFGISLITVISLIMISIQSFKDSNYEVFTLPVGIAIPVISIVITLYIAKKEAHSIFTAKSFALLLGICTGIGFTSIGVGTLFRIQHYPGASFLNIAGYCMILIVFVMSGLFYLKKDCPSSIPECSHACLPISHATLLLTHATLPVPHVTFCAPVQVFTLLM